MLEWGLTMTYAIEQVVQRNRTGVMGRSPDHTQLFNLLHKCDDHSSVRCLLINDIFAPMCDYAGNVDLNKCYSNPKRKLGVTTHFSKIIHE